MYQFSFWFSPINPAPIWQRCEKQSMERASCRIISMIFLFVYFAAVLYSYFFLHLGRNKVETDFTDFRGERCISFNFNCMTGIVFCIVSASKLFQLPGFSSWQSSPITVHMAKSFDSSINLKVFFNSWACSPCNVFASKMKLRMERYVLCKSNSVSKYCSSIKK